MPSTPHDDRHHEDRHHEDRHHDDDLHDLLLELARSAGLLPVVDAGPAGEVSMSELFALHELDTSGGLAQQDLADRLRLDKSTVSRLVAGLERRGLVDRERDPGNRRFVRLALTEVGRDLHRGLAHDMHTHQRAVLGAMSAAERSALRTGLTGLLRALHEWHDGMRHAPQDHVE